MNKFGKGPIENLTTGMNHATDIVLYHRYKQPEGEWETPPPGGDHSLCLCVIFFFFSFLVNNPCDRKKCEWLCLLSPSGPVCTCPNGHTLNNGTCVETPAPTLSPICE